MLLAENIRANIADNLIRVVVPIVIVAGITANIFTFLLAPDQHYRYFTATFGIISMIPPFVLNRCGKPLIGASFLLAGLTAAILAGMYANGGVHAPIFILFIVLLSIVVCLYGALKAIGFSLFAIAVGIGFVLLENYHLLIPWIPPSSAYLLSIISIFLFMALFFNMLPITLMQNALREQARTEKELKSILDHTPDVIYRLDKHGTITFINAAVERYGTSPEDYMGRNIKDIVHPEDWAGVERRVKERRTDERASQHFELRLRLHPKSIEALNPQSFEETWAVFQITSNAMYDQNTPSSASYIGAQGIARDVTKIKQFEEQTAQLAAMVEQAAEDMVITDTKGIIKYVNPTFEKVTGYCKEEAIGRTLGFLKSDRHNDSFYAELWNTIKAGKIWKGQIWNKIKNSSLILQDVTITPILNGSGKTTGYASVRRDITQQSKLQEQIQQAQKMEAIGTLAGGIAHDFNNILTGIIGYTQLAMDDPEGTPKIQDYLKMVLEAGRRATDLVRQILSFSRSQKKEPVIVSPKIIAKEVLKLMRASLPATIEIRQSINSKSNVFADPTNIHQVLMNLCTNAGHAMRETGGVLSVHLKDISLSGEDAAHHADLPPGDYLKISVEDTGCGIPEDIRNRVFDPFFTTKPLGEGTGMGLAAVHGIVKEIGGAVNLYSEIDKGTVFNVFLPVVTELSEIKERERELPVAGGTERILFVDDETVQIDLAKEILGRMGYQVTGFSDSLAALGKFQENINSYDLVITDMTMPKMTGDILVQKIRLARPDIPVIVCTGFSERMNKEKASSLGINAFLHKPVIPRELLQTIRSLLDHERENSVSQ